MANKGRHTNGSQFFITLQPSTWMDTKYVAFGYVALFDVVTLFHENVKRHKLLTSNFPCRQIIEGTEVLKTMEIQTTNNDRPLKDIKITDSGICTYEF